MESVIRVYSDGSGYKGYAGAAAVLIRTDGVHDIRRVLRYRLGPLTEHTVYESEAVGIILGAHLLLTEAAETAARPSSISLDNQAVIRASKQLHKAQPGHALIDSYRDLAYHLEQKRAPPYKLGMYWISGHDDAELNEFVDGQAKLAAEGDTSDTRDLPGCLLSPPRTSLTAARQEYMRRLKVRWQEDWMLSPRYERHRYWAPDATAKRYLDATSVLSRKDSATLFQLRSGHAPLNAHLHRLKCAESPTCSACGEGDETVSHFVYECAAWNDERARLKIAAGKLWRSRAFLLGRPKGIDALMAYVRETGRMKWSRNREDDTGRPEEGQGEAEGWDQERDGRRTHGGSGVGEGREGDDGSDDEGEGDDGVVTEMDRFLRWFRMETETERGRRRERDST